MTQSEFENKLIEVIEDCAKSLRVQCKIMQDRNFLLEETNAQTTKSLILYEEVSVKYQEALEQMSTENIEKVLKKVVIEFLKDSGNYVNKKH